MDTAKGLDGPMLRSVTELTRCSVVVCLCVSPFFPGRCARQFCWGGTCGAGSFHLTWMGRTSFSLPLA